MSCCNSTTAVNSNCIFCGFSQSTLCFEVKDMYGDIYELRKCGNCTTTFLSPIPGEHKLQRAYSSEYYGRGKEKFSFGFTESVIEWFRKRRAAKLSSRMSSKPKVLDIGCGNGNFLKHLKNICQAEAHGIERDSHATKRAMQQGIVIHTGTGCMQNFDDSSFDAVTLFHVFEHLQHPAELISEIHRILKPGGLLVMSFPDIGSWQAKIFRSAWLHLDPPRHLFFVRRKYFAEFMYDKGFEKISERGISPEQNPYGAVQSILNLICNKRDVLFERLKGNTAYAPEYGSISVFFQKLFFFCTFPVFIFTDVVAAVFGKNATVSFTFTKK